MIKDNIGYPVSASTSANIAQSQAGAQTLGTTAKFTTDHETRVKVDALLAECGVLLDACVSRRRLYERQEIAHQLLAPITIASKKNKDVQVSRYRVAMCLRGSYVRGDSAWGTVTDKGAVYREMQRCGSVWHCPICSASVSRCRCDEIKYGMKQADDMGYMTVMLTLTARHDAQMPLQWLYKAITKAHARMWSGGDIKALKARYGVLGLIRDVEVTYSRFNGFHPHVHELVFMKRPVISEARRLELLAKADVDARRKVKDAARLVKRIAKYESEYIRKEQRKLEKQVVEAFKRDFAPRWEMAANKHGLSMNEHGFDITNASGRIAEYVAKYGSEPKWREADEMTKWQKKSAAGSEHCTPWELLDLAGSGETWAGDAFIEYAKVFHGQKQLHWSEGLKKTLEIAEMSEEDIIEAENEDAHEKLIVETSRKNFAGVIRRRARAQYLDIMELGERDAIQAACYEAFGFIPMVYTPAEWQKKQENAEKKESCAA